MGQVIQFHQRAAAPGTDSIAAIEFAAATLRLSLALAVLAAELLSLQVRLLAQALNSPN
jgi:hypothetical protein